jgi:hypothetical protein
VTLTYFEKYYFGRKLRLNYLPLIYARELWSVHDRVVKDLPRTNNSVEAWYKAFEMCCGAKPGVYKFS